MSSDDSAIVEAALRSFSRHEGADASLRESETKNVSRRACRLSRQAGNVTAAIQRNTNNVWLEMHLAP